MEDGEAIVSEEIDIDSGLTENASDREVSDSVVKVWLTGGDVGERYEVACEITTDNDPARIDERTITIDIKNK